MPRDIPVGNGRLLVNFDSDYFIRDIYYPHVGHENHTAGHGFKFGIWTEEGFRWMDGSGWDLELDYGEESLLTEVRALNRRLGAEMQCKDCVDYIENIYIKKILLKNLFGREREFRLFFHQDFHILESPVGDTAYYDPDEKALIHYKEKRYFLVSGIRNNLPGIDQYTTGVKEFRGLEGTWRDAEDGKLEQNPIAQGSVDSVLSFTVKVPALGEQTLYYWICAAQDYAGASRLNKLISGHGVEYFIRRTENYLRAWLGKEELDPGDLPEEILRVYRRSLLIIRANIDTDGAIIAGNDSDSLHYSRDTYSYMWPRDGAFAAYALDMAGYHGITRKFFDFCLRIISRGKESVGFFLHKYNPDGSLGSSWHGWSTDGQKTLPIQEDGTGLLLWALWHHFERFRDVEFATGQYENLVRRCGDFLASYVDEKSGLPLPSYDLWEERWGIHTFTVSAVWAGIKASERFAGFFGDERRKKIYGRAAEKIKNAMDKQLYSRRHRRFLKSLIGEESGSLTEDPTVDASLYAPFYFGVFEPDDERVTNTMDAVQERLSVSGGIARYEGDEYYRAVEDTPGNAWFICTLWLAQWRIAKARGPEELKEAVQTLRWAAARALPSGVMAEQVHPLTNRPISVSPLTWSHAAFVTAVLEYLKKLEGINLCPVCGSPLYRREKRAEPKFEKVRI